MVEVEGGRQAVEARMDTFCQSPIRSRVGVEVEVEVEVDEGEEVSEEFIRAAVMSRGGGRGRENVCVCVCVCVCGDAMGWDG
jgi:hypothetical protein